MHGLPTRMPFCQCWETKTFIARWNFLARDCTRPLPSQVKLCSSSSSMKVDKSPLLSCTNNKFAVTKARAYRKSLWLLLSGSLQFVQLPWLSAASGMNLGWAHHHRYVVWLCVLLSAVPLEFQRSHIPLAFHAHHAVPMRLIIQIIIMNRIIQLVITGAASAPAEVGAGQTSTSTPSAPPNMHAASAIANAKTFSGTAALLTGTPLRPARSSPMLAVSSASPQSNLLSLFAIGLTLQPKKPFSMARKTNQQSAKPILSYSYVKRLQPDRFR